jgi:hypothetical protein
MSTKEDSRLPIRLCIIKKATTPRARDIPARGMISLNLKLMRMQRLLLLAD